MSTAFVWTQASLQSHRQHHDVTVETDKDQIVAPGYNPRQGRQRQFDALCQERTRALNIATIYRTLDLLVEEGLACRNDLGGGKVVYSPNLHGPHIHMVCRRCGQVIDGDSELIAPLGPRIMELYGFSADLHHISIAGECQDCIQNQLGNP